MPPEHGAAGSNPVEGTTISFMQNEKRPLDEGPSNASGFFTRQEPSGHQERQELPEHQVHQEQQGLQERQEQQPSGCRSRQHTW